MGRLHTGTIKMIFKKKVFQIKIIGSPLSTLQELTYSLKLLHHLGIEGSKDLQFHNMELLTLSLAPFKACISCLTEKQLTGQVKLYGKFQCKVYSSFS